MKFSKGIGATVKYIHIDTSHIPLVKSWRWNWVTFRQNVQKRNLFNMMIRGGKMLEVLEIEMLLD